MKHDASGLEPSAHCVGTADELAVLAAVEDIDVIVLLKSRVVEVEAIMLLVLFKKRAALASTAMTGSIASSLFNRDGEALKQFRQDLLMLV